MQCMAMRCCMKEDLTRYELRVSEDEARSPEKMKAAINRHMQANVGPKERDVQTLRDNKSQSNHPED
jgi:hypothetical protein